MPHVKGNKFKPKPPPDAAQAEAGGPSLASLAGVGHDPAQPAQRPGPAPRTGHREAGQPRAEAPHDDATGPAPKGKKRGRSGAAAGRPAGPVAAVPAVKTVVMPAPSGKSSSRTLASANWSALKQAMSSGPRKKGRPSLTAGAGASQPEQATAAPRRGVIPANRTASVTPVIALDCEMVGVGRGGATSSLAWVCVVNAEGGVLLDVFVKQTEPVTDYRTKFSGVRPKDLVDAWPLQTVRSWVDKLLTGRTLVGHGLQNDLEALDLKHSLDRTRDTARYPALMSKAPSSDRLRPRQLRALAVEQLGINIQEGEHSPVDDARAALYIYLKHHKAWEKWLKAGGHKNGAQSAPKLLSWQQLAQNDSMVDM